jgi:MinD superfamily P-loop ATPase
MQVAIASGKGGTGKTLLATNLAAVTKGSMLVDLDVEEPNCYLFQREPREVSEALLRPVPSVNKDR